MKTKRKIIRRLIWILSGFCLCLCNTSIKAQELEPRALTNVPVGMNFAVVGYGYAKGNILLDPSLPLEDIKTNLHTIIGAYVKSINVFGLSGKVDVIVPYAIGNWSGIYTGIDTTASRSGFGDARLRLSVNFFGAPALKAEDFSEYKPGKTSGLSMQIIAPTGQYHPEQLINLGSNRWVFKPQWGYSINYPKWIWETYVSAWFFTKNNNYIGGNELRQKPLYTIKVHTIRKLPKNMWIAMNVGYGIGARGFVNDEIRDNRISTIRLGLTYVLPLGQHHALKFAALTGIRIEKGPDFDAITVSYQYRWSKRIKRNNKIISR